VSLDEDARRSEEGRVDLAGVGRSTASGYQMREYLRRAMCDAGSGSIRWQKEVRKAHKREKLGFHCLPFGKTKVRGIYMAEVMQ